MTSQQSLLLKIFKEVQGSRDEVAELRVEVGKLREEIAQYRGAIRLIKWGGALVLAPFFGYMAKLLLTAPELHRVLS